MKIEVYCEKCKRPLIKNLEYSQFDDGTRTSIFANLVIEEKIKKEKDKDVLSVKKAVCAECFLEYKKNIINN